jgi:polyadenylate-binding protein
MGNSDNYNKATANLRYPTIKHGIESRLLENITDGSLKTVSDTNAVVKGLNKDKVDSQTLESFFTEKVGKVKCCKVSKTIDSDGESYSCKSNGYGFVNFESKELLDKAIETCNGKELEGSALIIERYNKEAKKETKFNNLYVRGFPESFTEDDLKTHFEKFGELGSVCVMKDQDGKSKTFGFVCFASPEAAQSAVDEMNGKDIDGTSQWYVAKFEKKANRWAALKKSLARANLYVRNFDKNVTEEDLKKFFGGEGVVRNVRIMTTDINRDDGVHKESKQFGFVSFNNPKDAADIMQRYNSEDLEFNNKQLYVNYYEDKSARKKRLATKKDNLMGLLDPSMMGGAGGDQGNMMEYFMQIFQQYFKQYQNNPGMAGQGSYGGYGQGSYGGYNQYGGRGRNQRRGGYPQSSYGSYGGHQNMYGRRPPQEVHNSYAQAAPMPPAATAPPMMNQMPPPAQAPPTQPPTNTAGSVYNRTITNLIKGSDFVALDEDSKREKIGEEIYNFVLEKAGDESAPKITGMIIDLPFNDLLSSVQTWDGLQEKIQEGLDLLKDDQ